MKVDVSKSKSEHSLGNKVARVLWGCVWVLLYFPSPRVCHGWRRFLLRLFGARVGRGARPYPRSKIWAPWNLEMGEFSCLGEWVDCYSVARIRIGAHATVSQYTFLCAATHDFSDPGLPLVTAPIEIGDGAWVTADVFVGPGVTIGEGAVIGARSVVTRSMPPWMICVGHPCRPVRKRELRKGPAAGGGTES